MRKLPATAKPLVASAVFGVFSVSTAMHATSKMSRIKTLDGKLMGHDTVAAFASPGGGRALRTEAGAIADLLIAGAAAQDRTAKARVDRAHGPFIQAQGLCDIDDRAELEGVI